MYRIFHNGETLATISSLTFVRMQDNGSYAVCEEADAQGIVLDGTVYHVLGFPDLESVDTVTIVEISETAYQQEQAAMAAESQLQNELALAELSMLIASMMMEM